jgi:ketosteroid isomerase-like protein
MRRILASVVVIALVTPWLLFGQAKPQPAAPSKNASVEQELIKLEEGWADAAVKGDVGFEDRTLADDYMDTDEEGTVTPKAQFIADLKSGDVKFTSMANDDYKVRVYGKAAVVTYRETIKGQFKGRDISGLYRETDTWVKGAGGWQCVVSHESKIVGKK